MGQTMIRQAYLEMPPVTRVYTTACVITTLAVQLEIVSPFQLYFNPLLILRQYQMWRIVTTFLFFGTFGFNFLFSMISFAFFVNLLFLGQAFTIMLVYVWARRNPYIRMNFFGLLTFNAPYLPWVLLGFSLLLGNSVSVDLLGMAVGHCYYFMEDIFPNQPGGWKILKTPHFLRLLCDPVTEDPSYQPAPEDRPGGFQWGQAGDGDAEGDEEEEEE